MAHLEDWEIEDLKRAHPLADIVRAAGHELKKHGTNKLAVLCPFHEEKTPSCVIDTVRNTFKCFGCGQSGDVLTWLRETRGVSFLQAIELLGGTDAAEGKRQKEKGKSENQETVDTAQRWNFDPELSDKELLQEVTAFYHAAARESAELKAYLEKRGLWHPEIIDAFKLGIADRTLGLTLPPQRLRAGERIRTRLQEIGVLRESGHEHLNGSLVIPIFSSQLSAFSSQPAVVQMYGRKLLGESLRKGTPLHLYLPGPLKGVFNPAAFSRQPSAVSFAGEAESCPLNADSLILCEALIDALTFWVHGFRNVTACYGVNNFTDELCEAIVSAGYESVHIAFDRDEAGDRGAVPVSEKLIAAGIACYRVQFPRGMDANCYALSVKPADKALGLLLRTAHWLGGTPKASLGSLERPGSLESWEPKKPEGGSESLEPNLPEPACLSPQSSVLSPGFSLSPQSSVLSPEVKGEDVLVVIGDRQYRVRGVLKNLSVGTMKVNVRVRRLRDGVPVADDFHQDTLDLCSHKAREAFARAAGVEFRLKPEVFERDLKHLLFAVEEVQDRQIAQTLTPKAVEPRLTAAERTEALEFLRSPNLIDQLRADFRECGTVGEETNLLVGYLGAVSRLLARPLGILIQSSSAAGKTTLMDAVLALMPKEAQVKYSAMTGQSLYYLGNRDLQHKILALAEEEGAKQAEYSLKLLQSEGEVTIASTGKDPQSGRLVTHEYEVKGPVMLFTTSTSVDIDEELLNRCIVLTVNEERAQTRAIHQRQREREGDIWADDAAAAVRARHRNAQTLLRPLAVKNPYARHLTFLDDKTRTRRDHVKYLTLMRAIALLHQYQRPVKTETRHGQTREFIEVTLSDIALANDLANEVLGRSLDELPPQTRRCLLDLDRFARTECDRQALSRDELRFSQRQIRENTAWGNTQLKIHLARLVELEYVIVHRGGRGQQFLYELVYDGQGQDGKPFLPGLLDVQRLRLEYDGNRAGLAPYQSEEMEKLAGLGRAEIGRETAGCRNGEIPGQSSENGHFKRNLLKNAYTGRTAPVLSHQGGDC